MTNTDIEEADPTVSSDGALVAFNETAAEQDRVWVTSSRGSSPRKIAEGRRRAYSWTPDSRKLLLLERGVQLLLLPVDGGAPDVLATTPHPSTRNCYQHRISPDGRWLTWNCLHGDVSGTVSVLYIAPLPLDGSPVNAEDAFSITADHWDDKPRWSPSGSMIYFVSDRGESTGIWAIRIDSETKKPRGEPFQVFQPKSAAVSMGHLEYGQPGGVPWQCLVANAAQSVALRSDGQDLLQRGLGPGVKPPSADCSATSTNCPRRQGRLRASFNGLAALINRIWRSGVACPIQSERREARACRRPGTGRRRKQPRMKCGVEGRFADPSPSGSCFFTTSALEFTCRWARRLGVSIPQGLLMTTWVEERIESRRTAPFHVQLELESSTDCPPEFGEARVQGRVVRVFRTNGQLAVGDLVSFDLFVCHRGDEPTGPAYIYFDEFVRATHVEAYLHGSPPDCGLAGYEFEVIDAPSEEPRLPVEALRKALAEIESAITRPDGTQIASTGAATTKRWWQFWKT